MRSGKSTRRIESACGKKAKTVALKRRTPRMERAGRKGGIVINNVPDEQRTGGTCTIQANPKALKADTGCESERKR